MTTPTETFQKASFNGVAFPILRVSVKGGLRHFLHEFPHSPGAEVEKMGRKAYSISMTAFFHDVPFSRMADDYPELYPQKLFILQKFFEDEKTGDLVIPGLGTIQACAIDWRRTLDYQQSLSGETFELEFLEDEDRDTIFQNVEFGPGSLKEKTYSLMALVGGIYPFNPPSIFQTINDVVTAIQAVQGIADAASKVLEAKLLQVANLCAQADRMTELQAPENWAVVEAVKAVWLGALDLAADVAGKRAPIATWRVPNVMSASQASAQIYGSGDRAMDLLDLNPIEDAFAIPTGTVLRYYRAA